VSRTVPLVLGLSAIVWSASSPDVAPAQEIPPSVESTTPNVVRVEAGGRTGFGFIVGFRQGRLLLATAYHTLTSPDVGEIQVCFAGPTRACAQGRIVHVGHPIGSQPELDLAILAAGYPDGLPWRPDVAAEARPGDPVWSIGRYNDWYVPETPGEVVGVDSTTRLVRYRGLDVAEGVSGAPILTPRGIVAMHVESDGDEARGIELSAIRQRVEGPVSGTWVLVRRASCDSASRGAGQLAGRTVLLSLDGHRPGPGLETASVLHCLGATVRVSPVWTGDPWPGNRVVYRSDDLRLARTLQNVLAPYARLDSELGSPAADAEVWIR